MTVPPPGGGPQLRRPHLTIVTPPPSGPLPAPPLRLDAGLRRPSGWWLVAAGGSALGFVLVLAVVVGTGGADRLDTAVLRHVAALRTPGRTAVARLVTLLGSFPVVVAAALLAAVLLWERTRSLARSAILLIAVVVTAAGVYLTKVAIGRARPSADTLLGTPSLDYAFPSGHTTNGTVVYVLGALLLGATLRAAGRRMAVGVAVVVAVAIGLTRVYLGYHWSTDVLAGWLLGAAVVLTATFVAQAMTAAAAPDAPAAMTGSPRSGRPG